MSPQRSASTTAPSAPGRVDQPDEGSRHWLHEARAAGPPSLAPAHRIRLNGGGSAHYREVEGPPGAPAVVLLHGWLATAALNWFQVFEPLGEHFRVVAPDLRGHGSGIRTSRRFRLADCADDVASLIDHLDLGPVIVVGYSMGGPVAQLVWRRHPHLVGGMVLCATGTEFVAGNRERYVFSAFMSAMAGTTRLGSALGQLPAMAARRVVGMQFGGQRSELQRWARQEMAGHSIRLLLEAGHAITNYSSRSWIHEIDVPTTVLITEDDTAVSPIGQFRMAMSIPGAHVNRVAGGHVASALPVFGRKITDACLDVSRRVALRGSTAPGPAG